ncbi:ankyrin repeat domain-containing protein [Bradyrhizobium sp. SZCCHNS2005]|uniref:ankyrin repeat domain-containing protein n=1 Tax=Bradyrhizobium sp. SZCCHNS2005 TaxID=3057303 RepID=UPI0028E8C16F|nr:ankyrin repeat domain-containing protein [Bradyrhizobium sp. SZCCHNS2005]
MLNLQPHLDAALIMSAARGRRIVVKVLLALGANKNTQNDWGDTPMVYAALNGHKCIVEDLLAIGADKEIRNNAGDTALSLLSRVPAGATNCGRDIIKILQ